MPWVSGAIVAGASLLGGERRNKAQTSSAQAQMDFQEEMSRTAHQRQVKDLRKAGLNPILSAKYGGASTPPGAMPQIQDTITPAVSTGMDMYQRQAGVAKTQEETRKLIYETQSAWADQRTSYQNSLKAVWEKRIAEIGVDRARKELKIIEENYKIAKRAGEMSDTNFGIAMKYIKEFTSSVLGGGSLVPKR